MASRTNSTCSTLLSGLFCQKDSPTTGKLKGKNVDVAKNQTSKGWFILATVIGSLVVIGVGGFGAVGLLQSHGLISLPHWLASVIGTVGNTPHFSSLWAIAIGGVTAGGSLMAFGAYKIHKARRPMTKEEKVLAQKGFGNHFAQVNEKPGNYHQLKRKDFYCFKAAKSQQFVTVVRTSDDKLLCTKPMNREASDTLDIFLEQKLGYTPNNT